MTAPFKSYTAYTSSLHCRVLISPTLGSCVDFGWLNPHIWLQGCSGPLIFPIHSSWLTCWDSPIPSHTNTALTTKAVSIQNLKELPSKANWQKSKVVHRLIKNFSTILGWNQSSCWWREWRRLWKRNSKNLKLMQNVKEYIELKLKDIKKRFHTSLSN